MSSSNDLDVRRRCLMAITVLLAAAAFAWITFAQPSEGRVVGVCTDAATGRPLADVDLTLSQRTDEDNTDDTPTHAEPSAFSDEAPSGWRQDTRDDRDLDAAGAEPRARWQAHTDDQGRFTFWHVPTGEYDLQNVWSSGHHLDGPVAVVVTDGQTAQAPLALERDKPRIGFINAMHNWTPEERPIVSVNGLLQSRAVQVAVERLDVGATLARQPTQLAHLDSHDSDGYEPATSPFWPGQFAPVRHWTQALAHADPEGAFTEHIPLGPLPPGVYRVTANTRQEGQLVSAYSWVRVTRLALVRKSYGDRVLAWVTDIDTGRPRANASIALYDQAEKALKRLAQARTSPDGLARLTTTGALPESEGVLIARDGDSLTALSLDLNSPGNETDGPAEEDTAGNLRSFIYTDRPVYRPGQGVNLKGIARRFDPRKGFAVPAHEAVTLDVRDGQDTLVSHQQVTTNDWGSWTATLALSSEALTGEYSVKAQIGEDTSESSFTVAAYQKPEYQATVTFSKDRYIHGEAIEATVTAAYYYGAPVADGKATVHVYRGVAGSDDGEDGSAEADTSGEPLLDQELRLDGSGQVHVRVPTKDQPNDTRDQTYTVSVEVDDGSGRTVEAQGVATVAQGMFSLEVTPSASNARPGSSLTVTLKATQQSGTPQVGQTLALETGYQAWQTDEKQTWTPVSNARLTTGPGGEATASVTPPRSGELILRAKGQDARGNTVTAEGIVWIVGAGEDIPPAHLPGLSLILDHKKYAPGQTAHLLLNTAHPGPSVLVTVEGRTLSRTLVIPLTRHANAVDLPVTADDAPSVTVSACCVLGKQFLSSDAALVVNDERRALQISVAADRPTYHPGDAATVRVRTLNRHGSPVPAEVSVGVVDSAIYAIQPEPPGTIAEAMQPAQDNAVRTECSCDEVYLGDVDKGATNIDIRRKFPDTALWRPDVRTGPDGRATVRLNLPDTLTTWRITCVGHTPDTAVGKGVSTMTVNKDLLIRLESPPFLTAGDTETVVALVHNNTNAPLHAQVRLAAAGLSVGGDASRAVDVPPGAPARLTWDVSAAQPIPAKLQVTAVAGGLSDGVEQPLSVLPHGAIQDQWHSGTLLRRISKDVTLDPQAIPGSTILRLRLASSVSSAFLPALDYLAAYPYGSTDATVSAFVPDVLLADSASGLGLSESKRADLRAMVGRSLLRLARFQNSDGGWGWFPNGKNDLGMTAYAAWGLSLARDAGYKVNSSVTDAAARELKSETEKTPWKSTYDGRYALAALALAGLGETGIARDNLRAMESWWAAHPEEADPRELAMATLAAHRLGPADAGLAQTLMIRLWSVARQTGSLCAWTASGHRTQTGVSEDMPDADATAWALLAALAVAPPTDPRVDGAARWLMANRSDNHWVSAETTAVAALGLAQYMGRAHELQPDFDAILSLNGKPIRRLHFGPESVRQPDQLIEIPGAALHPGANTFSLEKDGQGRLYYAADLRQCLRQPAAPPAPTLWTRLVAHVVHPHGVPLPPAPSGYRIKRVYLRTTTRRNFLWEDTVPTPDTHLNAGEGVLVRLIIQCTRPASRVVISEPVPAGCRIAEVSGDSVQNWDHWWDYTDVRDDHVNFFISDLTRGEHEIDYHLQAQTAGAYDVMPPLLTSTVDPTLYALGYHADHIQVDPKG